jgi:hypothetical protein
MDMTGHSAFRATNACYLRPKHIRERRKKTMFNYFSGAQSLQFAFYRIPKLLFTDKRFFGLSTDAKLLYGLLLDRMSLSVKNGWADADGRVYIIFTLTEIETALRCVEKSAVKYVKELEKIGLIKKKRQGQGKPTLIYVKNFTPQENLQVKNSKKTSSPTVESTDQDLYNFQSNYTETSDTSNDTDLILSEDQERMRYEEYLKEQLEVVVLKQDYPYDIKLIDNLVDIILDVLCSKSKSLWISKEEKPISVVKSRFMKLTSEHIRYILDCMDENTEKISNPKQYLLAALYNAPVTMESFYRAAVRHDMAEGKI